jgi:hypothetical protein
MSEIRTERRLAPYKYRDIYVLLVKAIDKLNTLDKEAKIRAEALEAVRFAFKGDFSRLKSFSE